MGLAERLDKVRSDIAAAAVAAGRVPESVALLAVSKFHPVEALVEAHKHGVRDFGENIVQELAAKASAMADRGLEVRWHLIGRLQKNKINMLLRHAIHRVQTIDSIELADALASRAPAMSDAGAACDTTRAPLGVLVQVNIGREPQKGGVAPEHALALCDHVAAKSTLTLRGLMAIPPAEHDPAPYFDAMRALHGQLTAKHPMADELSLGMSGDYASAIAHGTTMVRIGTAIFGERPTEN